MNLSVKIEQQISLRLVQPIKVDHLQSWSRIFRTEQTKTDLSILLPTEIYVIVVIIKAPFDFDNDTSPYSQPL